MWFCTICNDPIQALCFCLQRTSGLALELRGGLAWSAPQPPLHRFDVRGLGGSRGQGCPFCRRASSWSEKRIVCEGFFEKIHGWISDAPLLGVKALRRMAIKNHLPSYFQQLLRCFSPAYLHRPSFSHSARTLLWPCWGRRPVPFCWMRSRDPRRSWPRRLKSQSLLQRAGRVVTGNWCRCTSPYFLQ